MSSQKRGRRIKLPLIAALVLLILLLAVNVKIVGEPLTALARHELTFEEFVNTVESGYSSDNFAGKSGFVNVNGLFARLTGRRVLNKVIRGTNGMLTGAAGNIDMTELAASIEGFGWKLPSGRGDVLCESECGSFVVLPECRWCECHGYAAAIEPDPGNDAAIFL